MTNRSSADSGAHSLAGAAAAGVPERGDVLLELAAEIAHFGGWEVLLPERKVWWSDQVYSLFEIRPGTPLSLETTLALCAPEYQSRMRALFEDCARDGKPYDCDIEAITASGRRMWVRSVGRAIRGTDGTIVRVQGAVQEMTRQKLRETEALQAVQRLANTLETMSDAFFTLDHEMRFAYLNREAERMLQRPRSELLGKHVWDEFPEAVGGPSYREYARALRERVPVAFEEHYAPLGRWFEVRGYPSDDGLAVYFHDISAAEQARASLQVAHRALQMLSRVNHLLVHADNERQLLEQVCQAAVDSGGYRMAWAGFLGSGPAAELAIAAHAAQERDAACLAELSQAGCAGAAHGDGPVAQALHSGQPVLIEDLAKDARFGAHAGAALACGFRSAVFLPMHDSGRIVALLALYSEQVITGGEGEAKLLQELAGNIGFGIQGLRAQALQEQVDSALRDADARMRAQAELLDQAQDGIIVRDLDDRIVFWNRSAERMYGWTRAEALGRPIHELLSDELSTFYAAKQQVLDTGQWMGEINRQRKDGTLTTVEVRLSLIRDDAGAVQSILSISTDVSHRREAEREIERLAFYDRVTGLPNRILLLDRLGHALAVCARSGGAGALMFIDIDRFKHINDTVGHQKGDQLLNAIATRLRCSLAGSDTLARFGGDEFMVLVEQLSQDEHEAARQATAVCRALLDALRQPFKLDGQDRHVTASVGVTMFSARQGNIEELLKQTDMALYQMKAAGRNGMRFFDPAMEREISARTALEAELREASSLNEFQLYYQPQVDQHGCVVGAEALIRWNSARRGSVPPSVFIPIAEQSGQIGEIGHWVLETACAQLARWAGQSVLNDLCIAINVSASQMKQPAFVSELLSVVKRSGADPGKLKLEITESMLVENSETTIAMMHELKGHGLVFSLDDFGTGYSSLNYLKRMPLDQLKIDQSFVRDVLDDPNDAAIVRTIIELGRNLRMKVIAEGVETAGQRDFLGQHGCTEFQGYLFSPALPVAQFEAFVRRGRADNG